MEWDRLLSKNTQAAKADEPSIWAKYPTNDFEKDYKTIISSAAFRRLQDKTQVFPLDKSDFVRTRLTHSIEVSTIAKQLGVMVTNHNKLSELSQDSIKSKLPVILSCAGLLHDLGNPPFGHFGEVVIGDWFKENLNASCTNNHLAYKGIPLHKIFNQDEPKRKQMYLDLCNFEGNAQALRILTKISDRTDGYDVNLSFAVINSLIKYPCSSLEFDVEHKDIKFHKIGYYLAEQEKFNRICTEIGTKDKNGCYRHPLTFLLEAADDIAYITSDLEDALKKGLFDVDQFIKFFRKKAEKITDPSKKEKSVELIDELSDRIDKLDQNGNRTKENEFIAFQKWTIYVKGWLMYVVAYSFSHNYKSIMSGKYKYDLFKDGFHSHSVIILKDVMKEYVFESTEILKLELSAHKIISSLLSDFIKAVIHWDIADDDYKPSKTDNKLIELISENYKQDYLNAKTDDEYYNLYLRFLMVTDFISGMTDSYAKTLYQDLTGIS